MRGTHQQGACFSTMWKKTVPVCGLPEWEPYTVSSLDGLQYFSTWITCTMTSYICRLLVVAFWWEPILLHRNVDKMSSKLTLLTDFPDSSWLQLLKTKRFFFSVSRFPTLRFLRFIEEARPGKEALIKACHTSNALHGCWTRPSASRGTVWDGSILPNNPDFFILSLCLMYLLKMLIPLHAGRLLLFSPLHPVQLKMMMMMMMLLLQETSFYKHTKSVLLSSVSPTTHSYL